MDFTRLDPKHLHGLAMDVPDEGTETFDALQISEKLQFAGASMDCWR